MLGQALQKAGKYVGHRRMEREGGELARGEELRGKNGGVSRRRRGRARSDILTEVGRVDHVDHVLGVVGTGRDRLGQGDRPLRLDNDVQFFADLPDERFGEGLAEAYATAWEQPVGWSCGDGLATLPHEKHAMLKGEERAHADA